MKKQSIKGIIVFILLILGMAYIPYIPIKILHLDYDNLASNLKIMYNAFCDLIFMIIIFLMYHNYLTTKFKEYIKNFKTNFKTSFKYYLIGFVFMVFTNALIGIFFKDATAGNENTIREYLSLYPIYMIFSISIYAPFVEEIIFRKAIYDIFSRKTIVSKYAYILTSGLIFANMHVLGISEKLIDYIYIIPYLSLGIAFAALYHKTENIYNTISMHFLHNTAMIILYFVGGIV